MIVDSEVTMSFRASGDLADNARLFAKSNAQRISDYIRDAVREKNERNLVQRMRFLSSQLSAQSAETVEEMDETVGDGIA